MSSQTSPTFNLTNLTTANAGIYTCHYTNTVVTGLTLYSRNINLIVDGVNVNEPPTDIILSNSTLDKNSDPGAVVATLSSTDANTEDTFTYSFVSGDGDTDNASFTISGDQLLTNDSFDFETQSSFYIRIQTEDSQGEPYSKSFTIDINDSSNDNSEINSNDYSVINNIFDFYTELPIFNLSDTLVNTLDGYITEINFSYQSISGRMTDLFADLDSLSRLDLSHNLLSGSLPEFFGDIEINHKVGLLENQLTLGYLNIAYNQFIFSDFEGAWDKMSQIPELIYYPQANLSEDMDTTVVINCLI